jgi:cyclophilin family peptidyl-prolyl cis-trans isomerase
MRRAVQEENRSIEACTNISKLTKGQQQQQHPHGRPFPPRRFSCGLALIVLSPIAIVLLVKSAFQWQEREQVLWEAIHQKAASVPVEGESHSEGQHSNNNDNSNNVKNKIRSAARGDTNSYPNKQDDESIGMAATATKMLKKKDLLVLSTVHGDIRITLRPDLSAESVDYIHRMIEFGKCDRCNFYRAEKPGILQGVMAHQRVATNTVYGSCPPGMESVQNNCPAWDAQCGCRGPVMTKGAVAWAAGQAGGPDFFIDNYPTPATFWGTQHTNFGFIDDPRSFQVIQTIFELPVKKNGMMNVLVDHIHFDMKLETVDIDNNSVP